MHATGKCPVILALAQKEEESIGTSDQDQRILDTIYEEAFEKKRLMVIYGRYLVAALKNRYTYDDILNAAWIRFAEKLQEGALSGFDHESALRYFAGIFRNIIFDYNRRFQRFPLNEVPNGDDGIFTIDRRPGIPPDETPFSLLVRNELGSVIDSLLQRVRENYAQVVRLKLIDGLSHEEISDRLGLSRQQIYLLFYRGKKELQSLIAEHHPEFLTRKMEDQLKLEQELTND